MPIDRQEINTDFILAYPETTVEEIHERLGGAIWHYIIVELGTGQATFRLPHLIAALLAEYGTPLPAAVLDVELGDIPALLTVYGVAAVDAGREDLTVLKAKQQAIEEPLKCVVVRRGGEKDPREILGVISLLDGMRAGDELDPAVDLQALPERPPLTDGGEEKETDQTVEKQVEPRIINAELIDLEDFDRIGDPLETPLQTGRSYRLAFFIDRIVDPNSFASRQLYSPPLFDLDTIELTVQLESDDFEIDTHMKPFPVPRKGKSRKVAFEIVPKVEGDGVITALFLKDGAFVQVMTLRFKIGVPHERVLFTREPMGRSVNEIARLKPRDVTLTILEGPGGFQMIMSGATAASAILPLTKPYLHDMIAQVRRALRDVVEHPHHGERIYQTRIDIPPEVSARTLARLANAGWQLYEKLFYGPGHDLQANRMGDTLKYLAGKSSIKLQIFSKDFLLPWGLLYVGDDPDHPDPEHFLGLKHIVEHVPLQQSMQVLDQEIDTSGGLSISLNVNRDIDAAMGQPFIQRQIDFWQELVATGGRITEVVRADIYEVIEAIRGETADQFLYFYCHAIAHGLGDEGGPDRSRLILTGQQELTLARLRWLKGSLPGQPIVFLNACESAQLSPEFYDGFVPYFVNKGARGVIGTECEVPALFAEEFAKRFFGRFLTGGQILGEIFLELRREFFYHHDNILGLLYGLYIDADTVVSDPVLA